MQIDKPPFRAYPVTGGITFTYGGLKISKNGEGLKGKIFVTSGLGGMSGAQPKAGNIAGCISITAEVNQKVIKRALSKMQSNLWN